MKTGQEVLIRALELLGYTDNLGNSESLQNAELIKRGQSAVRQIYDELKRIDAAGNVNAPWAGMQNDLQLSQVTIDDVMPYGVAMIISGNSGDANLQSMYADLYNQKRKTVPKKTLTITDVIPCGGY